MAWCWVGLEALNGLVHPAWSVMQGEYTAGVVTSLLPRLLAVWLGVSLVSERRAAPGPRPIGSSWVEVSGGGWHEGSDKGHTKGPGFRISTRFLPPLFAA